MKTVQIKLKTDTGTEVCFVLWERGDIRIDLNAQICYILECDGPNVVAKAMHASLFALACALRAKWDREERVGLPTEWLNEDQMIEAIRITSGSLLINECGSVLSRSNGSRAGRSLMGSVIADIEVGVYGEEAVAL